MRTRRIGGRLADAFANPLFYDDTLGEGLYAVSAEMVGLSDQRSAA